MSAKRGRRDAAVASTALVVTSSGNSALVDRSTRPPYREPRGGEYWRVRKAFGRTRRQSLVKGAVLLVTQARAIDGALHSIVLAAHPLDKNSSAIKLVLADFVEHFVFEPEGERVRREEIAALQRDAQVEHQTMLRGPTPDELGIDPDDVEEIPALPSGPTAAADLAKPGVRDALDRAVGQQMVLAEAHQKWLKERQVALERFGSGLTSFYSEQSAAVMARAREVQAFSKQLTQGVKTMGLYLGDGVEVETLREGEGAPSDVPLTLFQAPRYMDEEYAVYLALGGATWRTFGDFAGKLGEDRALLERVLPTERCVVAMRYRRRGRDFDVDRVRGSVYDKIRALWAFASDEAEHKRTFLLIRNGENAYRVKSELATDKAPRLFPTTAEKDEPFVDSWKRRFAGVDAERITPEDAAYYEARTEYDQVMLFYKRLMVLMWGLHDRLRLFGEFYDPAEYPNFMSLRLQTERFVYVYDQETLAIGEGRPSFQDWWMARNAALRPGSRVLCLWHRLISLDNAPGAKNASVVDDDSEGMSVAIAVRRSGRLYVEPLVEHSWSDRRFHAKVELSTKRHGDGYLVLDEVDVDDLDFYINSRAARPQYMGFLALFMKARTLLLADRKREAVVRKALADELSLVHQEWTPATVREAVGAAVRAWRAAHKGAELPRRGARGSEDIIPALRKDAEAFIGGRDDVRQAAEMAAVAAGRAPLRVTVDGNGAMVLYATSLPEERPFGDAIPHRWIARGPLTIGRDGPKPVTFEQDPMPVADRAESVLVEWPGARESASSATHYDSRLELERLWQARLCLNNAVHHLDALFGSLDVSGFLARYDRVVASHTHDGHLQDRSAMVPIGLIDSSDKYAPGRSLKLVCVAEHGLALLWASGHKAQERAARILQGLKDGKQVRTWTQASVPRLVQIEMSRAFEGPHNEEVLNAERIVRYGYDFAYDHGVAGYESIATADWGEYKSGEERRWGDDLADVLAELSRDQLDRPHADRIVFLAPGVESWLRGRSRPAVRERRK